MKKINILFVSLVLAQALSAQIFTEISRYTPFEDVADCTVAFADVDGDNDKDVLITGGKSVGYGTSKLYTNDGEGNFVEVMDTDFISVRVSASAFSDVDGDGDQDILITGDDDSDNKIAQLYTNDGNGHFTAVAATPFAGVSYGTVTFSDVDNDGDEDVLITGWDSSFETIAKLYLNDGEGHFTEVLDTPFAGVVFSAVAFADVDGDGDEDVLISGYRGNVNLGDISRLYLNDGLGHFTQMMGTPFVKVDLSAVAFADIDDDGDQDVLITGRDSSYDPLSKLYTNDGLGNFTDVGSIPFDDFHSGSVVFSDIDSDGDEDLLLTGYGDITFWVSEYSQLYRNDGNGNFTEITETPFIGVEDSSVALADADGDGDEDILIAGLHGAGEVSKLYLNDGAGNFKAMADAPIQAFDHGAASFADVNGDGLEDLLITGERCHNCEMSRLYINNEAYNFVEKPDAPFLEVLESATAFADVDGDGDQDALLIGNNFGWSAAVMYLNDGAGNFTVLQDTPFTGVSSGALAFADVDADGDQDVLITGRNVFGAQPATLYLNDGAANFTEQMNTPFASVSFSSLAFADVDNDGDQDVLITGRDGGASIANLYTNDGTGTFTEVINTPFVGVEESAISFSDIDNDGDEDVLIIGRDNYSDAASKLYTNDGNGTFTEVPNTPFENVAFGSLAFSDVDGDGDQDVLITGLNDFGLKLARLYTNDGNGTFAEVLDTPFEGVWFSSSAFSDVDGDGDPDVLIAGRNTDGDRIAKLYINESTLTSTNEFVQSQGFEFVLFPNPATSHQLTIKYDAQLAEEIHISIYDSTGRLVNQQKQRSTIGVQHFLIDISGLHPGAYLLQTSNGSTKSSRSFLVQK